MSDCPWRRLASFACSSLAIDSPMPASIIDQTASKRFGHFGNWIENASLRRTGKVQTDDLLRCLVDNNGSGISRLRILRAKHLVDEAYLTKPGIRNQRAEMNVLDFARGLA